MSQPVNQALSKIFLPSRLWLGLAIAVVGVAVVGGTLVLGERTSIRLLLFGALFVVMGVGIAVSSYADACAGCKKALEDTSTAVPIEHRAAVIQAVNAARTDNVQALLAVTTLAFPATSAPVRWCLLVGYCPQCQAIAQISSAEQRVLPDGATTEHNISPQVLIMGPHVATLVDAIGARNEAWTNAMYAVRPAHGSGAAQ